MTPDEQSAEMEQDPGLFISHIEAGVTQLEYLLNEDLGLAAWAVTHGQLEELNRRLAHLRAEVATRLGDAMPNHRMTVVGVGTFERHKNKAYTQWDKDALLRDVLDTKLVDPDTGEVSDESPLDKVLHVWNLPAPRKTALKDRGLRPDEYASVEDRGGWTIRAR